VLHCRSEQVRLEPDGVEDRIGREAPGEVVARGGAGMDGGEALAHPRRECRVRPALPEEAFPERQVEKLHGEKPGCVVVRQHARRRARRRAARRLQPQALVAVALDGRLPELRYAQARQRALHAERTDAPDVGGHAAGQHLEGNRLVRRREARPAQEGDHFLRERAAQSSSRPPRACTAAGRAAGRPDPARTRCSRRSRDSRPSAAGAAGFRRTAF
jgi:hypothetical protein